jgi:hypothetical protein
MFGEGLNGAYAAGQPRSWGDPIWMRSGAADVLADPNNPYSAVVTKNSKQTYDHATELYKSPLSWDNGVLSRVEMNGVIFSSISVIWISGEL